VLQSPQVDLASEKLKLNPWLHGAEPFVPQTLQVPQSELLTAHSSHNSPSVFNDDAPLFEPNGQPCLDFEFADYKTA
jgi:hypothetical protein